MSYSIISSFVSSSSRIRSHTIIYRGTQIGDNFQAGHHVLIRERCKIGNNVSIGSFCDIEDNVTIGNDVTLHSGVFVPALTVIKDGAWIGPNVTFTNDKYPGPSEWRDEKVREGVTVCERVTIGASAVIMPGVVIGQEAIVGAGAVVTESVPSRAVVAGNPAKIIRWRLP